MHRGIHDNLPKTYKVDVCYLVLSFHGVRVYQIRLDCIGQKPYPVGLTSDEFL